MKLSSFVLITGISFCTIKTSNSVVAWSNNLKMSPPHVFSFNSKNSEDWRSNEVMGLPLQGDYLLQRRGNVTVSWRLVSDFQRADARCWGWTYHIFIMNGNSYNIRLEDNGAYQNRGDGTTCWEDGEVDLTDEVIPAGRWRDFTFRVTSGKDGKPGTPGLRRNISWQNE